MTRPPLEPGRRVGALVSRIPPALILGVLGIGLAALAGMMTAIAGGRAGVRAVYYLAIFGLIAVAGLVAITRKEPLRFIFLALIACFPLANALVPPGRFGFTVFNVVSAALLIGLLGKKLLARDTFGPPVFPTASLLIAWLAWTACAAFSEFPALSFLVIGITLGVHVFFWFCLAELDRERGFERLMSLMAFVLLVLAAGLFLDYFLHVNLSLRGSNLNQMTWDAGLNIYRAGGFFQDPQLAGAFLACLVTFLLVLSLRGRFREGKLRFLVWIAVFAGLAALPTTVSRSALLTCLLVSVGALFVFNAWSPHLKLALTAFGLVLLGIATQLPPDVIMDVLPNTVSGRFLSIGEALQSRMEIWLDTWDMFAEHPLTGIGPGSFQPYLMETRPGVYNYYGIGLHSGVTYIPNQPESGYLTILYEGGLLGTAAALLVGGDAIRRIFSVIASRASSTEARTEMIAALAGLAAFAIPFATRYTLGDPRVAGLFALLLAVIWHRSMRLAARRANV